MAYINHKDDTILSSSRKFDAPLYMIVFRDPFVAIPISDVIDEKYEIVNLDQRHQEIVDILDSSNYESMICDWSLIHDDIDMDPDEYIENQEWNICFNVANYISSLWRNNIVPKHQPINGNSDTTWEILSNMRGVFQINVSRFYRESHSFVIYIKDDDVIVYQGYGGIAEPSWFVESRERFFDIVINGDYNQVYRLFRVKSVPRHNSSNYILDQTFDYERLY